MAHLVFISHASEDRSLAKTICQTLEQQNIPCWVDWRDVRLGEPFAGEIVRAVRSSKIMVLIFSACSNRSKYVFLELEQAFKADVCVICFQIDSTKMCDDLDFYLTAIHRMEAISSTPEQFIPELANQVRTRLATFLLIARDGKGMTPPSTAFDEYLKRLTATYSTEGNHAIADPSADRLKGTSQDAEMIDQLFRTGGTPVSAMLVNQISTEDISKDL